MINHCKSSKEHLLIGCFANSHYTVWDSSNINSHSQPLLGTQFTEQARYTVRQEARICWETSINCVHLKLMEGAKIGVAHYIGEDSRYRKGIGCFLTSGMTDDDDPPNTFNYGTD